MGCLVSLTGKVIVGGGNDCGCSGSGAPSKQQPLELACPGKQYPATVSTDCPTQVQTFGSPGAEFVDLPGTSALGNMQLLVVRTRASMVLRVGAAPALLVGASGTFPTGFAGGETFAFTVDLTPVPVVFTAAAQTAAQVAQEINQAAIGAGLSFLPARVMTNGQLELTGLATGLQGSLAVTTANAVIGFPSIATAVGAGRDHKINGLFIAQYDNDDAPTRVQISGQGYVEALAAGAAAA